jgi:hypothetical protein
MQAINPQVHKQAALTSRRHRRPSKIKTPQTIRLNPVSLIGILIVGWVKIFEFDVRLKIEDEK